VCYKRVQCSRIHLSGCRKVATGGSTPSGSRIASAGCLLLVLLLRGTAAQAVVYHVATTGDDAADGTSPQTAWRTVTFAATVAAAGDTVYIKAGFDCVRLRQGDDSGAGLLLLVAAVLGLCLRRPRRPTGRGSR
jgi:hypothetical protein